MGCSIENKKSITITNACQKFLDEPNRRPNKIWIKLANFTID